MGTLRKRVAEMAVMADGEGRAVNDSEETEDGRSWGMKASTEALHFAHLRGGKLSWRSLPLPTE